MKTMQRIFFLAVMITGGNVNAQLWKQYADSAKTFTIQKNKDKEIELYRKAKEELKKDSANTKSYAQICDSLGVLFSEKGRYNEAEKIFMESKQLREKLSGKEDSDYARSGNYLADLYLRMGQYEQAGRLCMEAKKIREKVLGKEHPDYAASCAQLALFYVYTGQQEEAEPLYLEAKIIQEKTKGKENRDYASTCNELASLYQYMGQYKKAEPLYGEAKQVIEKIFGKEHSYYAGLCNNLALLYADMGQYDKAESLYLEALNIQEKTLAKDHPEYAASCNNLGVLYGKIGWYDKAESFYLLGKKIQENLLGKNHPDYAASCSNIAGLYLNMGQYEKAEQLYLEAKQKMETLLGNEHPRYAMACENLSTLYMATGQYKKAEPLNLEAKQILEKGLGKEHPVYASSCEQLATLYWRMERFKNAEPLYLEAKNIEEKMLGKTHPAYARTCFFLAVLYTDMGLYDKAEPLLLEAKQIQEKLFGKQHPDYASYSANLAVLYWQMEKPAKAEGEFKESLAAYADNVSSVFQFTNEKEKTAFIKNILGGDEKAYSFYLSEKGSAGQPYSLSLFHRNLILSSSQALKKQLFFSDDSVVIKKYNDWLSLKKYLSVLYTKPVAERKEDVIQLEENAGLLEKDLYRLSGSFNEQQQQQRETWQTIHQNLKEGEAAIEFVVFQYYTGIIWTDATIYLALILRKDKPEPEMVPLFEKKQLDSILNNISKSTGQVQLNYLYTKLPDNKTKSLYDLVWKPLEEKLKDITTIYFAPAGSLYKIAFSALPVSHTEVLSDKYQLVQLNTTASSGTGSIAPLTGLDTIILYGGVRYDADSTILKQSALHYSGNDVVSRSLPDDLLRENIADFNYLSGTENEVEVISKLAAQNNYNTKLSEGLEATEESFKTLSGKNSPAVLHIATHGFFFPDPKMTGRMIRLAEPWCSNNQMIR